MLLTDLPPDIIRFIFTSDHADLQTLVPLMSTSIRMYTVFNTLTFWNMMSQLHLTDKKLSWIQMQMGLSTVIYCSNEERIRFACKNGYEKMFCHVHTKHHALMPNLCNGLFACEVGFSLLAGNHYHVVKYFIEQNPHLLGKWVTVMPIILVFIEYIFDIYDGCNTCLGTKNSPVSVLALLSPKNSALLNKIMDDLAKSEKYQTLGKQIPAKTWLNLVGLLIERN